MLGTIAQMNLNQLLGTLPDSIRHAVGPLIDEIPIINAMPWLHGGMPRPSRCVNDVLATPEICRKPELIAAIWLYVDELDKSHAISQRIDTPTGSFLHDIMHRREGDFWNSHYWFRRVGSHPAMRNIGDYDAHGFIDRVEQADPGDAELLDLQRREWAALFSWCANA